MRSDEGPTPPNLMGGDGARGPGVSVAGRREPREKMVTLRLEVQPITEKGPIVGVQCDRLALCEGSSLMKNLLNVTPEDEAVAPLSTEHVADEETLRCVVGLLEALPSIPEDGFPGTLQQGSKRPHPVTTLHPILRDRFKTYLQQVGNRGALLKVLVAAHYLGCPKIVLACSVYLANAIDVWISFGKKGSLFGESGSDKKAAASMYQQDGDPLGKVPLPILGEIADLLFETMVNADRALTVSDALFYSMACVDRLWGSQGVDHVCSNVDMSADSCKFAALLEKRVEVKPNDPLMSLIASASKIDVHPRWKALLETVMAAFAADDSKWVNGPPAWLLDGMDLSSPCLHTSLMLRRVESNSAATVGLPLFDPDSVDETGAKLLELAKNARSLSVFVEAKGQEIVETSLDVILCNAVNLTALDIRQRKTPEPRNHPEFRRSNSNALRSLGSARIHPDSRRSNSTWNALLSAGSPISKKDEKSFPHPTFPDSLQQLLEVLLVDTMRVEHLTTNCVDVLPQCLKRLWIRGVHEKETYAVIAACMEQLDELEDLVLDWNVDLEEAGKALQDAGERQNLRVWLSDGLTVCRRRSHFEPKRAWLDVLIVKTGVSRQAQLRFGEDNSAWDVEVPKFFS